MKTISVLLTLAFTLVGYSGEPTAKSLVKCPSGHSTLKDVAIVYGLPPFKGEAAEKWDKGVENLEFVTGGCVSSFDSPKHEVICTTCRFAHSIFSTNRPKDGWWTGYSPDAKSFPKPISDLAKTFPVPQVAQLKQPASYVQSLNDALNVQYDGISYRTLKPIGELKDQVNEWLKAQHIQCSFSNYTHTSTLDDAKRDILRWQTEKSSVSIDIHHEHSDKTSWVSATFYR